MRATMMGWIALAVLALPLYVAGQAVRINKVVNLCQSPGMFALTFDQGPSIYTGTALDALDARSVKASFHPVVSYLSDPAIVANIQRASATGHMVGLAIESSMDISTQTGDDLLSSIDSRAQALANVLGFKPVFLRVWNVGNLTSDQVDTILNAGYVLTTYNLDSYDYSTPNVLQSYKNVLDILSPNTKGAFIAVQRDTLQASCNAVGNVVDYVKDKGYTFVTLDKCVRNYNPNVATGSPSAPNGGPAPPSGSPAAPGPVAPAAPRPGGGPKADAKGAATGHVDHPYLGEWVVLASLALTLLTLLF